VFIGLAVTFWALRRRRLRARLLASPLMQGLDGVTPHAIIINPFLDYHSSSSATGIPAQRLGGKGYIDSWPEQSKGSTASGSSRTPASGSVDLLLGDQQLGALPTEELVRILNVRLQGHSWVEGEAPPVYPV
jgi:hypothetical protein